MAEYQSRFTGAEIDAAIANARSGLELQDAIIGGTVTEIYTEAETVAAYALQVRTTLKTFVGPNVKTLGNNGLYGCTNLVTVDFPGCTSIGSGGLQNCNSLTTLDLPVCTTINPSGLLECSGLTLLDLPACTYIGVGGLRKCTGLTHLGIPLVPDINNDALSGCTSLATLDLPVCKYIGSRAFDGCTKLATLVLRLPTRANLSNVNAFTNTPIASGTGYVYVPAALVESYKTATNWVTYASQIRAIEDYPEITGGAS